MYLWMLFCLWPHMCHPRAFQVIITGVAHSIMGCVDMPDASEV